MPEVYFAPTRKAQLITLLSLQQRLIAVGLFCTIEEDSLDTNWIIFETYKSTLYVSTAGDNVNLVTFESGINDDVKVVEIIGTLMDEIGFSADEDADYA